MSKYNNILKEIKDLSKENLEDLYFFVHSLNPNNKSSDKQRKKILSFGGAFSDMSAKDYAAYLKNTQESRDGLFDRNIDL